MIKETSARTTAVGTGMAAMRVLQRGESWCDSKCGRGKGEYTAKVEWVGG